MTILKAILPFALASGLFGQGEYGGPSVLSRGMSPSNIARAPVVFNSHITVSGVYDVGLTGATLDSGGKPSNDAIEGVEVTAGTDLSHRWRHSALDLNYSGAYRHYSQKTYYDGTDQLVALIFSHQLARRISLSLRESGGTYTRRFGFGTDLFYSPSVLLTPGPNIFDNRTDYLSTAGDITMQMTSRLSVNFGGSGYIVRRQSSALYGVTGYNARGDLTYRLSRNLTLGGGYTFTNFDYLRVFGTANFHSVGGDLAYRLTKTMEIAVHGGAARLETLFVTVVTVDPLIAAITGQTTGLGVAYGVHYVPTIGGRFSYGVRHSSFGASYERGISPGNGVILTSRQERVAANYAYSGIRTLSLSCQGQSVALTSVAGPAGNYHAYFGGAQAAHSLRHSPVNLTMDFAVSRYGINTGYFQRNQYRASVGLGYNPGGIPIRLW